jgi:hypothetical protein
MHSAASRKGLAALERCRSHDFRARQALLDEIYPNPNALALPTLRSCRTSRRREELGHRKYSNALPNSSDRYDVRPASQFVKAIRPPTHKLEPFVPKFRPRVSSAD